MWHLLLPKIEGPGWSWLLQSGAWVVGRVAPACWIQLMVHWQATWSYKCLVLYEFGVIIHFLFYFFLQPGYCNVVVSFMKLGWFACPNHFSCHVLYFEADWGASQSIERLQQIILFKSSRTSVSFLLWMLPLTQFYVFFFPFGSINPVPVLPLI